VQTLITGGTGFLGAQTARCLVEKGECPILFDINDGPHISPMQTELFMCLRHLAF